MSDKFEVANEAEIDAAIKSAQEAIEKDHSAPREISVTVKLHKHEEFPKTLYKGKEMVTVQDAEQQRVATAGGFGPYDHEAFTAKEA